MSDDAIAVVLARLDERTEAMQRDHARTRDEHAAVAADVKALREEVAEIRGAIRLARWAGGTGGVAGVVGLLAAMLRGQT